ncbi:MAG: SCO2322 family protein, partial [Lapillicoccus sp.]
YQLTNNAWAFSQKGPAETTPSEGSVEGWRWAIDDGTGATPRTPRAVVSFATVCGQVPPADGKKRVAVVVDYGRAADGDPATTPPEPTADCAVVPTAATGAEVLASVTSVRNDAGGLVCGIDDYPATGCGGQVATLTDAQKAADTSVSIGTTATPQIGGGSATTSGLATASVTPGTAGGGGVTAGPLGPVATAPTASSSGVPAVVWVGLAILVLGALALAWSAYRRRQTTV